VPYREHRLRGTLVHPSLALWIKLDRRFSRRLKPQLTDRIAPLPGRSVRTVALIALAAGTAAAASYYVRDLTLSHYDAKAHLVVARRVVDSIRPGWMQIGAVWLPLPHLLNLMPVQVDVFYRTGLSAVAFSVAGFVLGAVALWNVVARATGSSLAGWAAFAVFAAHPDVLYLQATPMTESLLMGLCLLGIALTWKWVAGHGTGRSWLAGTVLALACLTRYEAWPITAAAVVLSLWALVRAGMSVRPALARVAVLGIYPVLAILAFMLLSRLTVGSWLVTGGFFEVEPSLYHQPSAVLGAVHLGVRRLNGNLMTSVSAIGLIVVLASIVRARNAAHLAVILALAACVALPLYAFWNGHPFRIRYMVPLTMSVAAVAGLGVGLLPRLRGLATGIVVLIALAETPPFSGHSPMLVEAQRDAASIIARQVVTECLSRNYDHTPILASMSSLAPYMQETARAGFSIRQFIHEGIGQLWADSLIDPGRHASWLLIEEHAEGGDVLARLSRDSSSFLAGFRRECEGGGVALYRRVSTP
jgi:hypothetical protein